MVDLAEFDRALLAAVEGRRADGVLAVCQACVEWLSMTGAAITLMAHEDGAQEPVCATDAGATRIDEVQFALGDGPCVEAFKTGRAVLVTDIAAPTESRWPVFAAAITESGARGMFVFPLHVGASRIGVLDCYRDTPGPLDDHELAGALRAADAAVWTLLDYVEQRDERVPPGENWFGRLGLSRAEVHQATGMLCAQAGIRPPVALARLRAAAFAQGRSIMEVADDVLARRLRLDADGAWRTTDDSGDGRDDDRGPGDTGDDPVTPVPDEGEDR